MFYHNRKNQRDILKGLQIDEPVIFILWHIEANTFIDKFKNHGISLVVEKYYFVGGVTVLGESHCNVGVYFDKTIQKISISREKYDGYDDYANSFKAFQSVLIRKFGQPSRNEKVLTDFENCEWEIDSRIKIYHYVMDRFGLAEYLFIERN